MSATEVISTIIAGAAVLVPVIWFGISRWSEASKEVERLKSQNTKAAINQVKDEMAMFKSSVANVTSTINELKSSILVHRQDIVTLKVRLEETKSLIEAYQRNSSESVKATIRSELLELTKNLSILKKKSQG